MVVQGLTRTIVHDRTGWVPAGLGRMAGKNTGVKWNGLGLARIYQEEVHEEGVLAIHWGRRNRISQLERGV